MKIEKSYSAAIPLLISQGGNAAYANLPRGASASRAVGVGASKQNHSEWNKSLTSTENLW